MGRLEWKKIIELANNSIYVGHEKAKKGTTDVHVFVATEGSAQGILKSAIKKYTMNKVVMNKRKSLGYGNEYEIYAVLGNVASEGIIARELVEIAKSLTARINVPAENSKGRATDVEVEIQNWLNPPMCRVGDYYFNKKDLEGLISVLRKVHGKLK